MHALVTLLNLMIHEMCQLNMRVLSGSEIQFLDNRNLAKTGAAPFNTYFYKGRKIIGMISSCVYKLVYVTLNKRRVYFEWH